MSSSHGSGSAQHPFELGHTFEFSDAPWQLRIGESSDEDESENPPDSEQAGREFADYLVDLQTKGKSLQKTCVSSATSGNLPA